MENLLPGRAEVIDFARFKAQRADRLPLFDGEAQAKPDVIHSPARSRALSSREVEHRQRMLEFLRIAGTP